MPQLEGAVVLISGASRGVGAELARVCCREGACVVANYFQSKEAAEALASELNTQLGQPPLAGSGAVSAGKIVACAGYGDVTVEADMAKLAALAKETFGRPLTGVVHNALGDNYKFDPTIPQCKVSTLEYEKLESMNKVTVMGAVNLVKASLPDFKASNYGKVLLVGTNLVYNPVVTYHDYIAAKAGLMGLCRSMAAELGPEGVRVNLVAGGLLDQTDASSGTPDEVFEFVRGTTPIRKRTSVKDFAEACVYFLARASDCVTGQCISVDGGLTMP